MSGCAAQSIQIDKEKEVVSLDAETDRGSETVALVYFWKR